MADMLYRIYHRTTFNSKHVLGFVFSIHPGCVAERRVYLSISG